MNATTEVNAHLLKLIQYLQKQVATLVTTNNRTNPTNPPNPCNPSNASNTWNRRYRNTSKYCLLHGYFLDTSMERIIKNLGQ